MASNSFTFVDWVSSLLQLQLQIYVQYLTSWFVILIMNINSFLMLKCQGLLCFTSCKVWLHKLGSNTRVFLHNWRLWFISSNRFAIWSIMGLMLVHTWYLTSYSLSLHSLSHISFCRIFIFSLSSLPSTCTKSSVGS